MPHLRRILARHEPRRHNAVAVTKSTLGAALAIASIGKLAYMTDLPMLLAPFGASSVIIFSDPASPGAQPVNVLAAYAVATLVCVGLALALPPHWLAAAGGVGLVMLAMLVLRTTHPPAGALPIMLLGGTSPLTLLKVVPAGSLALILFAAVFHALPPWRAAYPRSME
jgi:CBS-domain-containing membrane protein